MPKEYRAEGIIKGIGKGGIKGKRILIPRAEVAREILPEELKKKGAKVTVAVAYRSIKPKGNTEKIISLFKDKKIAMVTFTSSSTVKNFVEMFEKEDYKALLNGVKIASIGPITAKTASELGIKTDIMPKAYTIPALTEAIVEYYKGS